MARPFRSPTGISASKQFVAGKDFGDFVVWRHDDVPAYQLACVVDDAAMQITEVVRGADLLVSTARQILLYRALGLTPPEFFHCPLMRDESGERLAKRHDALSLRTLRAGGETPESLRQDWLIKLFRSMRPTNFRQKSACEFFHDKADLPGLSDPQSGLTNGQSVSSEADLFEREAIWQKSFLPVRSSPRCLRRRV